ncbi:MAG: UDP-N-acetylglucosamine 2-epimerase (hydrolyzing), partial [Pygmaiobacter massiliensis]|nr:UDP-N-acetylglucosamine 2-epimerase (hydrolyzing) [Pygmaiobacter massiliensis]
MQKTVAVVTGTRAEYGLLRPVIEKIAASERLRLRLVVTGAHLSERFGNTVQEIEQSGVPIDRRIPILIHPSTPLGSCKTVADT